LSGILNRASGKATRLTIALSIGAMRADGCVGNQRLIV